MCLAIPMKLIEVEEMGIGTAELEGARYEVNLSLVGDAAVGDYVIVHAGFAIETLDREEADARLELFRQMGEAYGAGAEDASDR